MTNPNIDQGTINLTSASVTFSDNTDLNVTASYLTDSGIDLSFGSDAGTLIPTLVGGAVSENAYQIANVVIHLNRAQDLANTFKSQFKSDISVGEFVVRSESDAMDEWTITTGILQNVQAITINGKTVEYAVMLQGIYAVNSDMWS